MVGVQPFFDKGRHSLFWFGSQAACGKITVSGLPNCLNYCVALMLLSSTTPYWRKEREERYK